MPVTITGNNHFEAVPALPSDRPLWEYWNGEPESYDPLTAEIMYAGASAVGAAVELSGSTTVHRIADGEQWIDVGGEPNQSLLRAILASEPYSNGSSDLAIAGLGMMAAATTASRLLCDYPNGSYDYAGQTGIEYVQRQGLAPVSGNRLKRQTGDLLNTRPLRNVQARIFKQKSEDGDIQPVAELGLAASLHGPDSREWSRSMLLTAMHNPEAGTVSASVMDASRRGDFIQPARHAAFDDLLRYGAVIARVLE